MKCEQCQNIIEEFWCMVKKDPPSNHPKCSHPFFCSNKCREKWLDSNWRFVV